MLSLANNLAPSGNSITSSKLNAGVVKISLLFLYIKFIKEEDQKLDFDNRTYEVRNWLNNLKVN